MKKLFLILTITIFQSASYRIAFGQQSQIDSVINLLKTDKEDTTKLIHLYTVSDLYETVGNNSYGIKFGNQAIFFADKIIKVNKNKIIKRTLNKYKAKSFNLIGIIYKNQGDYAKALVNYFSSLKILKLIEDKLGTAKSYNNIGNVYNEQGNYPEALKNHLESLKIRELIGDKNGLAASYNNIGNVYNEQGNYSQALKYHLKSLKIRTEIGDKLGISTSYNNLGNIYERLNDYPRALKNHLISLKLRKEIGDQIGIATSYNNIGNIYKDQGNYQEAILNHLTSLKIRETLEDKNGIAMSYINIGLTNIKLNNVADAKKYLDKAIILSKEMKVMPFTRDAYKGLAEVASVLGNYKSEVENYKLFILYRDSIDNEETRKKTVQSQMTYDFEKKEAVAAAEHKSELKNQEKIGEEKNRKQKLITYFVFGGLLLVLVFAGFVIRSLRITKAQKVLIEEQKLAVELNQKEIIDSIHYAKRIQNAILPSERSINKILNNRKK